MSDTKMRPTREDEIQQINALIIRSKAHWNYSQRYLDASRSFLAVTKEWISQNFGNNIIDNHDQIVGFLGVEITNQSCYLEHLWIDPPFIGRGFGKDAVGWLHVFAQEKGCSEIRLLPDPPAEGFYEKMGALFSGKKVQSRVEDGPLFQEMIINLPKQDGK
jgi:GNAT superfamily N-acetyltransferase